MSLQVREIYEKITGKASVWVFFSFGRRGSDARTGGVTLTYISVLFGGFGRKMDGIPGLPGLGPPVAPFYPLLGDEAMCVREIEVWNGSGDDEGIPSPIPTPLFVRECP